MKHDTYLRIAKNYMAGKETVHRNFKYDLCYNPLAKENEKIWVIRAHKFQEDWDWLCPLPNDIRINGKPIVMDPHDLYEIGGNTNGVLNEN